MRCPKCHYLSFEPEPRCRNCGFDLSGDPADLALKIDQPDAPLADLTLRPPADVPRSSPPVSYETASEHNVRDAVPPARLRPVPAFRRPDGNAPSVTHEPSPAAVPPSPPPPAAAMSAAPDPVRNSPPSQSAPPPAATTSELPLFVKGMSAVSPPPAPPKPIQPPPAPAEAAAPSAPVQRRAQSTVSRPVRQRPDQPPRKPGPFDGDLLEDLQRIERIERGLSPTPPRRDAPLSQVSPATAVEPWRSLTAAAIDALFIGLLNVAILWLTLRWSELAFVDASLLPALPLATFFLLVALGYLVMFTAAGGQTVGKMIVGVRVVAAVEGIDQPLTVQQAALRSILALPSVLMLGLGFLPSVLGSGPSLHDRLAHTRIVRT